MDEYPTAKLVQLLNDWPNQVMEAFENTYQERWQLHKKMIIYQTAIVLSQKYQGCDRELVIHQLEQQLNHELDI